MRLNEHIRVYFTEEDKRKIEEEAENRGLKPSSWIRSLVKEELPKEVTA